MIKIQLYDQLQSSRWCCVGVCRLYSGLGEVKQKRAEEERRKEANETRSRALEYNRVSNYHIQTKALVPADCYLSSFFYVEVAAKKAQEVISFARLLCIFVERTMPSQVCDVLVFYDTCTDSAVVSAQTKNSSVLFHVLSESSMQ